MKISVSPLMRNLKDRRCMGRKDCKGPDRLEGRMDLRRFGPDRHCRKGLNNPS